MKIFSRYLRAGCSIGIISCFVLFLTASAPHRVHHLFENLPYPGEDNQEETLALSLPALAVEKPDDPGHFSDHYHPANEIRHGQGHHGHKHSGRDTHHRHHHDDGKKTEPQSQTIKNDTGHDHSPLSAAPLHANAPEDDAHHDNSAQTVCLLQSAAQHSHFSTSQSVIVAFLRSESEERTEVILHRLSLFNPAPFSQRAPPRA